MAHRGAGFGRVRAEAVAGVIDLTEVECDEVRTLGLGERQPLHDLIDARLVGYGVVIVQVVARPLAGDLCLRAGPEEAGCAHALLLCQRPERHTAIPGAIGYCLRIVEGVALLARGVIEAHGDDAVMLRVEAGHQRVVIGKGDGGIRRQHAIRRAGAGFGDGVEVGRAVELRVVVAEAVERDQHDVVLRYLRCLIVRVRNLDDAWLRLGPGAAAICCGGEHEGEQQTRHGIEATPGSGGSLLCRNAGPLRQAQGRLFGKLWGGPALRSG